MTDLNQKVEEARMVFVSHIARLTLTNEGGGIDGPAVQAYRALEAAIAARATAPLVEALEGIIADLPALGRTCGSYEQAAEILTQRLRATPAQGGTR